MKPTPDITILGERPVAVDSLEKPRAAHSKPGKTLLSPCVVVVDCSLWFRRRGSSYFLRVVLLVFRLRSMYVNACHPSSMNSKQSSPKIIEPPRTCAEYARKSYPEKNP